MTLDALTERAERAESELFHRLISTAPDAVRSRLGIATARFSGRVVTSVRDDATNYWSNALGFGLDEPVTAALVEPSPTSSSQKRTPGPLIQIAPALLPADWAEICDRHALRSGGARYQHICSGDDFRQTASTDLHVGRATNAVEWTRFTMRGFGMPEEDSSDMLGPGCDSDEVQLFAAWDGDYMVAAASSFVWQDVTVLNSGVTLPSHRNRGAQSALIASRAAAAADAGCRWLVTQTAKPDPGTQNPSTTTDRAGLAPLYDRPVWKWNNPK